MAKINKALKRTRKVSTKHGMVTLVEDKAIHLQRVYTAAKGAGKDGKPVIAVWWGVMYQHLARHRWLLSKNPSRSFAFSMDANKVFGTREAALASMNMKKCYYVDAGKVIEGRAFLDGVGTKVAVSIEGWTVRGKTHATQSAARRELTSILRRTVRLAKKELARANKNLLAAERR